MNKVLFIHPRRGLFQLTSCNDCQHAFECENCDAKLTTYKENKGNLELICHQCQSYYTYPKKCPSCYSDNISSAFGGIDELSEKLSSNLGTEVIRHDKKQNTEAEYSIDSLFKKFDGTIEVSTRVYDPGIDYSLYDHIIFIQAENLTANLDYLVVEETIKNLTEVFTQIKPTCQITMDTNVPGLDFFAQIVQINKLHPESINYKDWFSNELKKEEKLREAFKFPPFDNLLLVTSQEKNRQKAIDAVNHFKTNLLTYKEKTPNISISNPYPARILRRKNMYSYHILIKYPKQYKNFPQLREIITNLTDNYSLQTRLNPRHLF